ncbi:MAG: YgjV family protein [Ruminococcaceae bacterium]|nr:YgjV family protein [Oscillospiraceae bacterium]
MKPIEIVAQVVGIFGMLLSVLSYQQKGKARILMFQLLGSVLFVVNFFLLGAFSGAILNVVAIVRALIFIYEDKIHGDHLAWTIGLTAVYILSYVSVFTVFGKEATPLNLVLEVLPVIAMTVTTIAFRHKEDKILRRVAFISSPLWLTYNAIFFSLGGIIGETLNLSSAIIGTIRLDRKKEENKAEKQ